MTPDLPLKVWSAIAEHFNHDRDWARACGTCRTSFRVQPSSTAMKAAVRSLSEQLWYTH